MANETAGSDNLSSVNEIYKQRAGDLETADDQVRDEQAEADDGFDHSESTPHEEARFVANPADLRKEVDSEEKFSETLEDSPVEVEVGGETVTDPAEAPGESDSKEDDGDDDALPKESWKRDDIVQYLVDHEVIESEDQVEGQTKAQLIENFVG